MHFSLLAFLKTALISKCYIEGPLDPKQAVSHLKRQEIGAPTYNMLMVHEHLQI